MVACPGNANEPASAENSILPVIRLWLAFRRWILDPVGEAANECFIARLHRALGAIQRDFDEAGEERLQVPSSLLVSHVRYRNHIVVSKMLVQPSTGVFARNQTVTERPLVGDHRGIDDEVGHLFKLHGVAEISDLFLVVTSALFTAASTFPREQAALLLRERRVRRFQFR